MSWACIMLPHLALDAILRRRAESSAPLVLVGGPAQGRVLVDANAAARAAGLHPGQPLIAARALLARFETINDDEAANLRWQRLLAAWAYRYSSEVLLLPGALALEISRSLGLFGPWPTFERKLREDLHQLGFRHRLALAPTAPAARLLADVDDGAAIEDARELRQQLATLPLDRAGLPPATAQALSGMGIRQLGALFALPRAGLLRRFGAELPLYLEQLLGERPWPAARYRPPDRFDYRIELSFEVEHVAALVFPLRRLTADLASYLASRDGGVQRFTLSLEHRGRAPTELKIGLLHPEREAAMLFELSRERLERLHVEHPIIALRLLTRELPPFIPAGRALFDQRPANALPLEQLRERLRARLGDDAVYRLRATVDPRPEHAQARDDGMPSPSVDPRPRPTWLLPQPQPWRGVAPHILAGPERIESGWWDGGDVRRDYYLVRSAEGQLAWVYCPAGEQAGWMLHGWFA